MRVNLQIFSGLGCTSQRTRSVCIIVTKYENALGLRVQCPCFCPIRAKISICRQISVKISHVDVHGNLSNGSWAGSCGQTDIWKDTRRDRRISPMLGESTYKWVTYLVGFALALTEQYDTIRRKIHEWVSNQPIKKLTKIEIYVVC